jgi:hypothetical protein
MGLGKKAFCAGSDKVATGAAGDFGHGGLWRDQIPHERKGNLFPLKPVVTLLLVLPWVAAVENGCLADPHRIVCENSVIAMPGVSIGLVCLTFGGSTHRTGSVGTSAFEQIMVCWVLLFRTRKTIGRAPNRNLNKTLRLIAQHTHPRHFSRHGRPISCGGRNRTGCWRAMLTLPDALVWRN